MDSKLLKLINLARVSPEQYLSLLHSVVFTGESAEIDNIVWPTTLIPSSVTAVETLLQTTRPAFTIGHFKSDSKIIRSPESHPLLVSLHLLLNLEELLNNTYDEICLTADKPEDMVFVIISLRKSPYKTLASTQTIKQYQEKSRKVAQEILASPDLRKKFKVLFMKGNAWIDELARIYGPFTGYELNEFISWFRAGEKQAPKLKALPKAFEPKKPVLVSKISKNEAGIEPEGNVMIKKEESLKRQNPVEQGTNIFNPKSEESVKFTFKAKQRFNDLKEVLKTNKGFIDEGIVKSLPERECLEIIKDPPMSVPEKYEAFLIEEVLIPPPAVKTAPPSKPLFSTNFRLPDNLKIKTETAKQLLSNKPDLLSEPYVHKFRDDFDAKAVGKPEFVLRLPKPREEPLVRIAEPLEKLKKQQKEEKKRMEDEEKLRRTQLYGKIRGEWVFGFKPVSSFYELGTGEPHKLLPKDEYLETFKLSSRAS